MQAEVEQSWRPPARVFVEPRRPSARNAAIETCAERARQPARYAAVIDRAGAATLKRCAGEFAAAVLMLSRQLGPGVAAQG